MFIENFTLHRRQRSQSNKSAKGSALVEFGVIIGLISVLSIFAVLEVGVQVRCIFYNAAYRLGADVDPSNCGGSEEIAEEIVSPPDETPEPPVEEPDVPTDPASYTVAFDTPVINAHDLSSVSISVVGVSANDVIDLVVTQGEQTLTETATATQTTHQFTNLNFTSFNPGTVTAVATVTPENSDPVETDPATAQVNLVVMIEPDTPVAGMGFGREIAMSPSRIFVSAPEESFGANRGRIYVFDRSTLAQLFTIDPAPSHGVTREGVTSFGAITRVGNNRLAVSYGTSDEGDFVNVYDLDGNFLYDVDNNRAEKNYNYYGRELRIVGSKLLVGDQLHQFDSGNGRGAIHAFDLNNNGAHLWSAKHTVYDGTGSHFDADETRLVSTSWETSIISFWDMSDGSLVKTYSGRQTQRDHLELVGNTYIVGTNPKDSSIYEIEPKTKYLGSMPLPTSSNAINIYEKIGNKILLNAGDHEAWIIDIETKAIEHKIPFPDALPSRETEFGGGLSHEGGYIAIGAPGHQPLYDGVRSGAVYYMPAP